MSKRYTITVTEEQLAGLKIAVLRAQRHFQKELAERIEGVAFFERQSDEAPEKQKYLAMARGNLENARRSFELVNAAVPPLFSEKEIP